MLNIELNRADTKRKDDPFFQLFVLYILTGDTITSAAELELSQYNVNFPQARILYMLDKEKRPVTLQDLSKWILRELNSVSIMINKMEADGLVQKIKRPGDKKTYVTLTPKGADLYSQITDQAQRMIFSALTEEERKQFELYLKKLLNKARSVLGMDFKPPFLA